MGPLLSRHRGRVCVVCLTLQDAYGVGYVRCILHTVTRISWLGQLSVSAPPNGSAYYGVPRLDLIFLLKRCEVCSSNLRKSSATGERKVTRLKLFPGAFFVWVKPGLFHTISSLGEEAHFRWTKLTSGPPSSSPGARTKKLVVIYKHSPSSDFSLPVTNTRPSSITIPRRPSKLMMTATWFFSFLSI